MTRTLRTLTLLATAVIACTVWFVARGCGDGETPDALERPRVDGAVNDGGSAPSVSGARADAERYAGSARILGRVVAREGEPLPGVRVAADDAAATTGPDGTFRVDAPGRPSILVRISHPGYARAEFAVAARPDSSTDLGDIVLEPEARISGHVVDTAGSAVAGAVVVTSGGLTTTGDASGRFQLAGLRAGEHWLWAEAPGFASLPAPPVRVGLGVPVVDVILRLEPALTLAGTLVVADGTPVSGATIVAIVRSVQAHAGSLSGTGGWATPLDARSDGRGRFELSPLPRGEVELTVRHPGYHDFGRVYPADVEDPEIVLSPHGQITGRVIDAGTGEAVTIERVTVLASQDEEAGPWRQAREPERVSPEDAPRGRFSVSARSRRWLRIVAEGPDVAPVTSAPFRLDAALSCDPLTLRAQRGETLLCRAVDDRGRPVPGAEVRVIEPLERAALARTGAPFVRQSVWTGTDGRARSMPLTAGDYRIEVSRAGYFDGVVELLELQDGREAPQQVEVVLARAESIHGRLRVPGGGTLPALRVIARCMDEEGAGDPPFADVVLGAFEFERLAAGSYVLTLVDARTSHVHGELPVTLEPGRAKFVQLDFEALGSSVHGVHTLDGVAQASVEVTLARLHQATSWTCLTDRDGRFRFAGVDEGRFVLSARTDVGQDCFGVLPIDVAGQAETERDLHLTTGALAGHVREPGGEPLARCRVSIDQDVMGARLRVAELVTDSEGRFHAARLPVGPVLVSTEARYHENVRDKPWSLVAGGLGAALELFLEPAGSLVFHLKRHSAMAVRSDVEIEAVPDSAAGTERRASYGVGQPLLLSELHEGEYRIHLRTSDGFEKQLHARVVAGETRTVVVEF